MADCSALQWNSESSWACTAFTTKSIPPVPADLYLLLSGAQAEKNPESIPLVKKATAFQTQWNTQRKCAKHMIVLTML